MYASYVVDARICNRIASARAGLSPPSARARVLRTCCIYILHNWESYRTPGITMERIALYPRAALPRFPLCRRDCTGSWPMKRTPSMYVCFGGIVGVYPITATACRYIMEYILSGSCVDPLRLIYYIFMNLYRTWVKRCHLRCSINCFGYTSKITANFSRP